MHQFTGQEVEEGIPGRGTSSVKALGQEGFWLTARTEGRPVATGVQIGAKNWD